MLSLRKLTGARVYSKQCDPDYWTACGPDVGTSDCAPEVNDCAPDYGEDGCLPSCGPEND